MTDDEKLALLEQEMRCIRHKNSRAVERAKLLLALMEAHDRIAKGSGAAPEVPDCTGVEEETPGTIARKKLMAAANKK